MNIKKTLFIIITFLNNLKRASKITKMYLNNYNYLINIVVDDMDIQHNLISLL